MFLEYLTFYPFWEWGWPFSVQVVGVHLFLTLWLVDENCQVDAVWTVMEETPLLVEDAVAVVGVRWVISGRYSFQRQDLQNFFMCMTTLIEVTTTLRGGLFVWNVWACCQHWCRMDTKQGSVRVACSLPYPACNTPPYCHLRPVWLHHIFRRYLINGTILGEKVIEHKMCVLIFCAPSVWNISNYKKNSARYCHKCENIFIESTSYSCRILMRLEFSGRIFGKSLNMKFVMASEMSKAGRW
jgi:hypothetical protein